MHLVINSCKNVMVKNVKIIAPDFSPNTDGIHVQTSIGVTISGTSIQTGDDCVSIGPATRNLWMDKIQWGPGHGVSIGSLARDYNKDGVQNVTLINSVFTGYDNGLRIKSWTRTSIGFVTNINYQNIMMKNTSGIKINQVTYQNIFGTSTTQVAMNFECSSSNPCSGIKLQDIKLTYLNNKKAQSICKNIRGNTGGVILPDNCLL
ncbi:hypothetical protein R3W88_022472 [Solanum pinnatisectum]|uniref:Polygalacturonase n=1 Tax=Solanum pinnatisectum TaxID=50273 RepID=A0AAV9LY33_9SOLN|nr:hypothetical protein R3W88_022472 [Solanum pinnatisectum]